MDKKMSNIKLVFGGKDVTSYLQPNENKFKVCIQKFGDPMPYVYKFLHIFDTSKNCSVLVSENDMVNDLTKVFEDVPVSTRFSNIQHFVKGQGVSIVSNKILESLELCLLPSSCHPLTSIPYNHDNAYDFIVLPIDKSTLLEQTIVLCSLVLKFSANAVFLVYDNYQREIIRLLLQNGFGVTYLQRNAELHVIIAIKQTNTNIILDELDMKHNNDEKDDREAEIRMLKNFGCKFCPFCGIASDKFKGCDFVYCGLNEHDQFQVGFGCGRSFCWTCGLKYCGYHYEPHTGAKLPTFKSQHDSLCCTHEQGFIQHEYCPGGHSSHADLRW